MRERRVRSDFIAGGRPMNLIRRQAFRRLMPAFTVAGILAIAFIAPPPALAKSTGNCGVKAYGAYGYATHDHGKPCPNRPFPGHGIGVIRITAGLAGTSQEDNPATPSSTSKSKTSTVTTSVTTVIESDSSTGSQSASHGHGHGTASAKSHGRHGSRG